MIYYPLGRAPTLTRINLYWDSWFMWCLCWQRHCESTVKCTRGYCLQYSSLYDIHVILLILTIFTFKGRLWKLPKPKSASRKERSDHQRESENIRWNDSCVREVWNAAQRAGEAYETVERCGREGAYIWQIDLSAQVSLFILSYCILWQLFWANPTHHWLLDVTLFIYLLY